MVVTHQPQSSLYLQLKTKSLNIPKKKQRIPAWKWATLCREYWKHKVIIKIKENLIGRGGEDNIPGWENRTEGQDCFRETEGIYTGWRGQYVRGCESCIWKGRVGPDWQKPYIYNKELESNSMNRMKTWQYNNNLKHRFLI